MMKKLTFDWTVNVAHLLALVGLLTPLVLFGVTREVEMRVLRSDVARHEQILQKLTESQGEIAANLKVLTAMQAHDHNKKDQP